MQTIAIDVKFTNVDMIVKLLDGRTIIVPIACFPRLSHAPENALNHWELLGEGEGIHWPEIDEDISVASLLFGAH